MVKRFCRVVTLLFVLSFLAVPLVSTSAQAASITVAPIWRPGVQLTSIATPVVDTRHATAEIWVTTNVQIWLAQFNCTVNATVFTTAPVITWSSGTWGTDGSDFTHVELPAYAAGKLSTTASKLEPRSPVGANGVVQNLLMATVDFTIPTTVIANATSPFTCTAMFLDKNGKSIATATIKPPTALQILTGYSLKGAVTYPGRASSLGIGVSCFNPAATPTTSTATTIAAGTFTINSLRALGVYTCTYTGNITALPLSLPNSLHLQARTSVDVSAQGVTLAPVVLKGGDVTQDASIGGPDLGVLTGNFGTAGGTDKGDLNGDNKVDQADLAILTSGYNTAAFVDARHFIVGLSRNPSILHDNRIWLGNATSNSVLEYAGATTARQYWPMLSPDGTKVVYVQEVAAGTFDSVTGFVTKLPRYALFIGPVGMATGTQLTPTNWNYDAFAPVWSPDSTKIAFSCGTSTGNPATAQWSSGNRLNGLCVIDASGANLSVVAPVTGAVQRPAWVTNTQLVVAVDDPSTLAQYDLVTKARTNLANLGGNFSMPVFKNGQLFFLRDNGEIHVIDYVGLSLDPTLRPTLIPTYTPRNTAPATGYNTDVADNGDFTQPLDFSGICSFDVAATGMDFVIDRCDGTYTIFIQAQTVPANAPAYFQVGRVIVADGGVAQPVVNVSDPAGHWVDAISNSVNFVP